MLGAHANGSHLHSINSFISENKKKCLSVANGNGHPLELAFLNFHIGGSSITYKVINSEWRATCLINKQGLKWAFWQQVMCHFDRGQLWVLHFHLQEDKSCYIINWSPFSSEASLFYLWTQACFLVESLIWERFLGCFCCPSLFLQHNCILWFRFFIKLCWGPLH